MFSVKGENWLMWRLKALVIIIFGLSFFAGLLKILYKFIRHIFFFLFFSLILLNLSHSSFASVSSCSIGGGRIQYPLTGSAVYSLPEKQDKFEKPEMSQEQLEQAIQSQPDYIQVAGKAVCGDKVCGGGETLASCPYDCDTVCGNGICGKDETVWTCSDCGYCGDGNCADLSYESNSSCPVDCSVCGDGICSPSIVRDSTGIVVIETASFCPIDCDTCGNGYCGAYENVSICPSDCPVKCGDSICSSSESLSSCPADCAVCGDGVCSSTESLSSCSADCASTICGDGICGSSESSCFLDCDVCGNGYCGGAESWFSCPADCVSLIDPLKLDYKATYMGYGYYATAKVDSLYIYILQSSYTGSYYTFSIRVVDKFTLLFVKDYPLQYDSRSVWYVDFAFDSVNLYVTVIGDGDINAGKTGLHVYDKSTGFFKWAYFSGTYYRYIAVDNDYIYLSKDESTLGYATSISKFDKNYNLVSSFFVRPPASTGDRAGCYQYPISGLNTCYVDGESFSYFGVNSNYIVTITAYTLAFIFTSLQSFYFPALLIQLYDKSSGAFVREFDVLWGWSPFAGNGSYKAPFGLDDKYIYFNGHTYVRIYDMLGSLITSIGPSGVNVEGKSWEFFGLNSVAVDDMFLYAVQDVEVGLLIFGSVYKKQTPGSHDSADSSLNPYGFSVSSFISGLFKNTGIDVDSSQFDIYTPSGGSGGTLGLGVGVLGGSVQQGAGVGSLGSTSSVGNFNIGTSVGLGASVGSLTAPNQDAYTNTSYSAACDCSEVFSDFITQIKTSSLFSVISFSNLTGSSTGSSSVSVVAGKYGDHEVDLAKHSSVYPYIAALLLLIASIVSVKIIALPKNNDQ